MKKKHTSNLTGFFGVAFLIAGAFVFGGRIEGFIPMLVFLFLYLISYRRDKKRKKK